MKKRTQILYYQGKRASRQGSTKVLPSTYSTVAVLAENEVSVLELEEGPVAYDEMQGILSWRQEVVQSKVQGYLVKDETNRQRRVAVESAS